MPLGVCQLQRDSCNAIITAAVEWNVCQSGVLFTVNVRLGATDCTGVGTYTYLLLCDTCNSVSIAGVVSYSMLPLCSRSSTPSPPATCPPASAVPTALPFLSSLPPLPPLPPLPSDPPGTDSPVSPTSSGAPVTQTPSPVLAHGPRALGPAEYVSKTGQLVNAGVTLAEVFLQLDQDLYYLDFSECMGQAPTVTLPPLLCAACNYVNGPNCGRSPSGPQCTCDVFLTILLCGTQLQAEITPVPYAAPTVLSLVEDSAFSRVVTVYIPPGVSGPIRISVTVHAGSEEIYIAITDAADVVKAFSDFAFKLRVLWESSISTLTICPGTLNYPRSGQTFFILVTAFMRAFHTSPYVLTSLYY